MFATMYFTILHRCRTLPSAIKRVNKGLNINSSWRKPFSTSIVRDKLHWSYDHGHSDTPLLGVTIGKLLEAQAERHGSKPAQIFHTTNKTLTFESLLQKADQFAAGLMELGVKRGDRVGIWSPNYQEWSITQFGTARAGMILVNINPAYRANELEFALRKVGIKCLVMAETFKTSNYYEMACNACPELSTSTPGDITSKSLPDLKSVVVASDKKFPGAFSFTDVMDAGNTLHLASIKDMQDELQFDDPINIQFTSGTTGLPKGATLSHHNIVNNAFKVGRRLEYDRRDSSVCVPVPLYHCFGMVLGGLQTAVHGSTVVFPSPSFEPVPALESVQKYKCTSLYGTPTMFIDMVNLPNLNDYDTSSLYTGIMAGSPCPVEVAKQAVSRMNMDQFTIAYGTTETSPVTFQTFMDDSLERKVGTIGKVQDHIEMKIVDANNKIVPVKQKGELLIRGYAVMHNYWGDPDKTREVIQEDRWYRSGDLAVMDEDGYTQIVGRLKDVVIRGGENVYPTEIEQFLYKHPKISDIQVIGVPDSRMGEELCAWVKLKDGETSTSEEIKDFCKDEIAHFKIPKYILFVAEFPLTVTGKVQKYKMREASITDYGLGSK